MSNDENLVACLDNNELSKLHPDQKKKSFCRINEFQLIYKESTIYFKILNKEESSFADSCESCLVILTNNKITFNSESYPVLCEKAYVMFQLKSLIEDYGKSYHELENIKINIFNFIKNNEKLVKIKEVLASTYWLSTLISKNIDSTDQIKSLIKELRERESHIKEVINAIDSRIQLYDTKSNFLVGGILFVLGIACGVVI